MLFNYEALKPNRLNASVMTDYSFTSTLASKILKNTGLPWIWQLNVAAADAYRNDFPNAAACASVKASTATCWCMIRSGDSGSEPS